eukprot:COSAG06_NODE_17223_length_954_cov_1.146199_1_plen_151_part_10
MAPKKGVSRTGLIVQAVEEHMVGGLDTFAVVAAVGAMPLTIRRRQRERERERERESQLIVLSVESQPIVLSGGFSPGHPARYTRRRCPTYTVVDSSVSKQQAAAASSSKQQQAAASSSNSKQQQAAASSSKQQQAAASSSKQQQAAASSSK